MARIVSSTRPSRLSIAGRNVALSPLWILIVLGRVSTATLNNGQVGRIMRKSAQVAPRGVVFGNGRHQALSGHSPNKSNAALDTRQSLFRSKRRQSAPPPSSRLPEGATPGKRATLFRRAQSKRATTAVHGESRRVMDKVTAGTTGGGASPTSMATSQDPVGSARVQQASSSAFGILIVACIGLSLWAITQTARHNGYFTSLANVNRRDLFTHLPAVLSGPNGADRAAGMPAHEDRAAYAAAVKPMTQTRNYAQFQDQGASAASANTDESEPASSAEASRAPEVSEASNKPSTEQPVPQAHVRGRGAINVDVPEPETPKEPETPTAKTRGKAAISADSGVTSRRALDATPSSVSLPAFAEQGVCDETAERRAETKDRSGTEWKARGRAAIHISQSAGDIPVDGDIQVTETKPSEKQPPEVETLSRVELHAATPPAEQAESASSQTSPKNEMGEGVQPSPKAEGASAPTSAERHTQPDSEDDAP